MQYFYDVLKTAAAISFIGVGAATAAPELVEQGVLHSGSDMTYPPFLYLVDDVPTGFDVEVVEAIATRMGLEPSFVDTRFAALIPGIRAGYFDIIASALYVTDERKKVLSFVPYTKAGSSIMVLASESLKPGNVTELCGHSVSSIRGASWIPKLIDTATEVCDGKSIDIREFDTDAQATQAMRSGAVDAQFLDNVVAAEVVRRQGDEFEVTSNEVLYPVLIAIGVLPGNTELLAGVDKALAEIRADGSFEKIRAKFDMAPISDEEIAEVTGIKR